VTRLFLIPVAGFLLEPPHVVSYGTTKAARTCRDGREHGGRSNAPNLKSEDEDENEEEEDSRLTRWPSLKLRWPVRHGLFLVARGGG